MELVDRTTRTLVARRRFAAAAPVAQENARGAVEALSQALTSVLDELVPWLEASAAKLPAAAVALIAAEARCATRARAGPRHATSSAAS